MYRSSLGRALGNPMWRLRCRKRPNRTLRSSSIFALGAYKSGGWPTFTPPRTRLPHPSRLSKGEHLRPRHQVHASHTNTRVPYLGTLSPPVVTTGSPCLAPGRIAICFCRYSNRSASTTDRVWQKRFYDFNVWSERKRIEKLRYMYRNPVKRGMVERPEHWAWSSFRAYSYGEAGAVRVMLRSGGKSNPVR